LPALDILEEAEDFPYEELSKKARIAATVLEEKCQEFGINVKVVEVDTGPVITQFELELEKGLRLSKVKSLADDLAVGLRVPSVRIVPSIPGKHTVGVEVPNEDRVMVRLRELIEACPEDFEKKRIPLYLGKDVSGRPMVIDMAKMPHLLIAGRTGTGKSVCLNTLIMSILMTRTPDQVRMLMIDPKMVELSPYKKIPHLMHPVVTDMKKAEAMLAWAVEKMDERYSLMARCGVRHLDTYNKLGHEKILRKLGIEEGTEEADLIPETMPSIVIIADEMADMMMTCGKDVEHHIARLAGKSRAVGIHLVLATQKPTVDVVTGLIKSNLPARISFQVASQVDSRVVLDETGADKLLGNGDMLFLAPGTSHVSRAQGTYVSDEEITDAIDFYSQYETQYDPELENVSVNQENSKGGDRKGNRIEDSFYDDAVEIVLAEGRGSISMLQSRLGIGYGRAKRMIDYMTEDGIVAQHNGSNAREVIMSFEEWEATRAVAS
jgi:S-DNA-T family DNA segregation ATPase FtsK/SpoIIIE